MFWVCLAGGAVACPLVLGVLAFAGRKTNGMALALGLACFAAESFLQAAAARAVSEAAALRWQNLSLLALAVSFGPWMVFGLTFARGNQREFLWKWFPAVLSIGVPSVVVGVWAAQDGAIGIVTLGKPFDWAYRTTWPATAVHVACLLASVLVLMHIEGTFRASVGTARWRIKYAVIGLAILFGARIYGSSQVLLYSGIGVSLAVVTSGALALGSVAIGHSLVRTRLEGVDIYPSTRALHQTVTTVLVGLYLLVVGVLAQVANALGEDVAFPVKALLILVAMAVLGMLAMSDRVRQRMRLMVSRHFSRPVHDYRQVWSTVTERTAALADREAYCRVLVKLVSETFDALSVSLWIPDEHGHRLALAASTSLVGTDSVRSIEMPTDVLRAMGSRFIQQPQPGDLELTAEAWAEALREHNPTRFPNGGTRSVVPLVSGGEMAGVMVVGDRVKGLPLATDDFDLLKCLGEHTGAALRNLKMSGRLLEMREFAAFQTMSTFLVHDLKNTASTLSLMLRNMGTHFDNPEFREDAIRGLGRSVEHINDLIARLTSLRRQLELQRRMGDVGEVVAAALQAVEGQPGLRIERELQAVPRFLFDPAQLESVVANLVINAREALGAEGWIRVGTQAQDGWAVVTVADNGCGMAPEFVERSLFRPFQTTKKKGLGIGMFQSKMIVEAHGGRMEVETEQGQGTTFRVWLPMMSEAE